LTDQKKAEDEKKQNDFELKKQDDIKNNDAVNIESVQMQKGEFIHSCDNEECLCVSDIVYPLIKGLANEAEQIKLNDKFKEVATQIKCHGKNRKNWTKHKADIPTSETNLNYEIQINSPEILAITQNIYGYSAGAAHGGSSIDAYTVDKKTGKELLPIDLFGKNISYVNNYIYNTLKNDPEQPAFEEELEKYKSSFIEENGCNMCVLLVTKEGIKVSFAEYSIGPFSSGNIEVEIPINYITIDSLRSYIEKNATPKQQIRKEITPRIKSDKEIYEENCKKDYKLCKDNADIYNMNLGMIYDCKYASEKKAISTVDWGGMFEPNFSSYYSGNSGVKDGYIVLIDNVAKYKNEYNVDIKKTTTCKYNLQTHKVDMIDILPRTQ
jgi:hypothetical protein